MEWARAVAVVGRRVQAAGRRRRQEGRPTRAHRAAPALPPTPRQRLHADRVAAMKREAEKRAALVRAGRGEVQDLAEADFMEAATAEPRLVAHFYHADFPRCALLDRHLAALAAKHLGTRFVRVSAPVGWWWEGWVGW